MEEKIIVTINQGKLNGKTVEDDIGIKYFSFQGIPYAKPPLGELRFKAPHPAEAWDGIRDATSEGSECFSRHLIFGNLIGSEDCLFLNVYTPELPKGENSLKPVMVWIHGGGFSFGSGNTDLYSPDFLLRQDVVVVTINYRLGLLGFLNFEDPSLNIPGNAGLKDQVMALKWVKDNISKFNGNPDNVTIFGESAGGASVHYLMLSPMAKGLFHKAIIQSGCAISPWARGLRSAPEIAKALNSDIKDEKEIFKLVQTMTSSELLELQNKLANKMNSSEIRAVGPVVEVPCDEPAFLLEEPIKIIQSKQYNHVPMMIGYCNREGLIVELLAKIRFNGLKLCDNFEKAVPNTFNLKEGSDASLEISKKLKKFYFGNEKPSEDNLEDYYLLQTDTLFLRSIVATVKNHVATTNQPVYFFRVSLESKLNMFRKICNTNKRGVCHSDELGYLFKNITTPTIRMGSMEYEGIYRFTKLWSSFARNGNPNLVEHNPLVDIDWKPAELDRMHYLNIGENLTTGVNPEYSRMKLWDEICSTLPSASKL